MARRRKGNSLKTSRQSKNGKKSEKLNGLSPSTDSVLDDSSCLMETDSTNGFVGGSGNGFGGDSASGEPVVHHKKFGKIRMSGQQQSETDRFQDVESPVAEGGKDFGRSDSKSSDENESESLAVENNRFASDAGVMDIMRGIEISGPKGRSSYSDFRTQSSVYKVENDIPLDGSVIIKPGTFSSNTISSNVKPNLFFDSSSTTELNPVNFLKVLQGIEMLERKVSGSLEFDRALPKQEKEFLLNTTPPCTPMYLNEESDSGQSKNTYSTDDVPISGIKTEEEMGEKNADEIKTEENSKATDISSPEDTSSDYQNETEETVRKLQSIALDEGREMSESPISKMSDDTLEKKTPGFRSRTGSTDTAGSESSSNSGAAIRRSNRIRSIGIMKQKEREQAAVKTENVIKSPLPPGSPAVGTPTSGGFDDKPVKVKSRWRRSSELEMHGGGGKGGDSEGTSSNCPSPVNSIQQGTSSENSEMTPEDLEKLERQRKEIEDGLRSFTAITENEYRMERTACKETKRMICDCVLTKEDISKGEVGCGEDCLNRMLFLECGSRCALGDRCTNKRFQKRQYANCKIFKTEKKGFGLRAEEDLSGNTFIMEYVGEVVDQKEFGKRAKMYAKDNNKHFYFMALKSDAVIDATNKGNISRFINHSCDPNAETQKWTINGELRVGFFTRRFIPAGEEITFDYQFQRYGKQAQRCYCEASCCRGWIGEDPDDGSADEDEDEEDEEEEEEEDEDEDDEEEEEEQEEEEEETEDKKCRKSVKSGEEKEKKKEPTKRVSKPVTRRPRKEKKERKGTSIVEDMAMDEEIQKLFKTGLKNRAHTLTLSRLMVRAEDWSTKSKLLQLIREGETPCRRLFLDYHGLRLICSWMISREVEESPDKNERRLEILKTLSKLPIPNKNMLIDSKVLSVVEQWAKSGFLTRKLSMDEESSMDEMKRLKPEETIPGLGGEIEIGGGDDEEDGSNDKCEKSGESGDKVKRMAEAVLESWSSLKEVFKIPKKERIEQMKEHERQADRGYSEYLDNKENFRDKYDRHDRYGRSDRYRDRDRDRDRDGHRIRDRKRMRDSPPDPEWFRNHDRHSKLTKQERRQLFALKVLQEDEEAKKRNEHLEMWKQHESRCLALGLDPNLNAACDPQTGFPIFFDHSSGSWQNCPPSAGPSPSLSHPVTPSMCPSPMYSVRPSMVQNCAMCPSIPPMCSNVSSPVVCHNGMMQGNNIPITNGPANANVPMTPSYPNMTPQYQTPISHSNYENLATSYEEPGLPGSEPVAPGSFEEGSGTESTRPVITEAPLNAPIKLPPKWKSAKDAKGRVYYYHVKERVSQWEPPQWTEEDARKEAERTVALEMGEDSSSSTDSSTDSSSEEEDDEENEEEGRENESTQDKVDNEENTESQDGEAGLDSKKKVETEVEAKEENGVVPSDESNVPKPVVDDKDEDLSAWEDEDEVVKAPKPAEDKVPATGSSESKSVTLPPPQPAKGRRAGLVQEIMISPRREEDRVDNRKYKEVKEMLRRQKEESRAREKQRVTKTEGKAGSVRLSRNVKKKRKEKVSRSNRIKSEKLASLETPTDKKIKENFKNTMAGAIVSHLNPYRKQDCKIGRITCNEDFKHLARKLTHFVMLKELKHCKGVDDLECNESVKAKAKDFIKKYMAKFGAVYQRPQHEVWKT